MPRVQSYRRSISTAPAPASTKSPIGTTQVRAPQITATPSAESFGAGLGETISRVGAAALNARLRYQEEQFLKQNQVKLDAEQRILQDWELQNLHDPENGALTRQGQGAIGIADQVDTAFEKFTGERRAQLGNDQLREAYDRLTLGRRDQIVIAAMEHENRQMAALSQNEVMAGIQNHASLAELNVNDPVRVGDELAGVREGSERLAKLRGLGAEETKNFVTTTVSATHRRVIERLADANPYDAATYYSHAKGELTGEDDTAVRKVLETGTQRADSQQEAARILAGRTDKTTLTELLAEVDKIRDADLRDQVESRVRSRFAVFQAERDAQIRAASAQAKDILDGAAQDAWNFVRRNPGKLLKDLIPAATLDILPPETQRALETLAKSQMPGQAKIETDLSVYYKLLRASAADPKTRQEFADTNLIRYVDRLSESDFKHLAEVQAAIQKGDGGRADQLLEDFRGAETIIRDTLRVVTKDLTSARRDDVLAQVHGLVADFQRRQQLQTGKKATDDDIQGFVDGLVIKGTIKQPGFFYGTNEIEKRAYELAPGQSLTVGGVSIERDALVELVAGLHRIGRPVTAANIAAAAIALKGGGGSKPAGPHVGIGNFR